ncbi:MAG: sensor hybrid histidine kinase [Candidatus Angelobacter sp.]|nr:sensor hybrid histidine kinase [Candidatus Angelobacter sp.]
MSTLVMDSCQTELLRVLLVEDNAVDARFITALLRSPATTMQWKHVTRLGEALEHLKIAEPDVVLLDLNLEDSAGYETFYRMRRASRAAILVLSASDDEELAIRTVREGAQDYLVKGTFDGRLLLRSIRYAIERKRSEEALRHSETTLRAIFENSLDGIVIFSGDGICREANAAAAALINLPRTELIGCRLCDFCDKGFEEVWKELRCSESGRGQFWAHLKNGSRRLVDYCFTANILPGQHLAMLRDITEQQNMEEQLRDSQKMEAVGRLAGGVAHDFNNILGIIRGHAELLESTATGQVERGRTETIISATEKAASLTQQLLAFGRKQLMSPKLLDLSTVLEGLSSMVDCLMGAEVQIRIDAKKCLGLVRADQSQMEQVIMNLTANAREAMPEGGTLTIRIDSFQSSSDDPEPPPGEYAHLSVSDTGVGMSAELQSRIFEPFFTTKTTGSGLGLSTVYGIVKQSGGYLTVQSLPELGSTFNIYLPVVCGRDLNPAPEESRKQPHLPGDETILLVDNEEDLRNAAGEYLERCGYRVLSAGDGKEAVEICERHAGPISLLISDIAVPKLSGRGLVDYVRKTRPATNVLMISGYADDAVRKQGIFLDPSCFLQKPFTFQALSAKIRGILDKKDI